MLSCIEELAAAKAKVLATLAASVASKLKAFMEADTVSAAMAKSSPVAKAKSAIASCIPII